MSAPSDRKPDGGPAFPAQNYIVPADLEARHVHALGKTQGMTLRDWFAGQALGQLSPCPPTEAAEHCYRVADAMLKERAQ